MQDPRTTVAIRNEMLDAFTAHLDAGFIRIYNGAKPATADTPLSGQALLATLAFAATAFAPAALASATANAITPGVIAATGNASWFRMVRSDGITVGDGTVGVVDSDMNMNSVALQVGAQAACSSFVVTIPT